MVAQDHGGQSHSRVYLGECGGHPRFCALFFHAGEQALQLLHHTLHSTLWDNLRPRLVSWGLVPVLVPVLPIDQSGISPPQGKGWGLEATCCKGKFLPFRLDPQLCLVWAGCRSAGVAHCHHPTATALVCYGWKGAPTGYVGWRHKRVGQICTVQQRRYV